MGNWWAIWDDVIDKGPNAHQVSSAGDAKITANSVEELAEKMAVPLEALQATFAEYATMCETQSDPAFGRKLWLTELNPPYYAFNNRPVRYKTIGGVAVDVEGRLLKANGDVVNGVWACGIMGVSDYSADIAPAFASGMYVGQMIAAAAAM
jgi:fumarate reductase flavoprotein subunit